MKEHLWSALTSLASAPVEERTLTGLAVLLQSDELKQALQPYCLGGPYGRLLDAETERLGEASSSGLRDRRPDRHRRRGAPCSPICSTASKGGSMAGRRCSSSTRPGSRSTIGGFAAQLREWLKTLRKKNASVVFATQSLADIDGSAIAPAIIESCPTRIFLPNERAIEPQIRSDLPALRTQRPPDRDHRPRHAQARLLLPVTARQSPVRVGTGSESRSPSARPRPRPITSLSTACSPSSAVMPSSKPGSPTAACCGPPISFPT